MNRVSIFLVLLVTISISLSGCTDLIEIDEEIYPLVIGIDIGVSNKVRVTIQYPSYKSGNTGTIGQSTKGDGGNDGQVSTTGEVNGTVVTTIESPTVLEGINLLNTAIARTISLTHTKMIVFSERLARKGVDRYIASMTRYREARRIMHVVVCRGKAEDFIKSNISTIGASATKSIELMVNQSVNSGLFSRQTFVDFYEEMLSPCQDPITAYAGVNNFKHLRKDNKESNPPLKIFYSYPPGKLPRKGAARREFAGTAVFKGDKMVGYLNEYETRYFQMIIGKLHRALVSIKEPKKKGYCFIVDERMGRVPDISGKIRNGKPEINVKLNLEGDLCAVQSRTNYDSILGINELNHVMEKRIQKGVSNVIKKVQREFKADIFGFGFKIAGHFNTIQELIKYDWHKHFPKAKVNLRVVFNMRRTGLMFGTAPISGEKKSK